MLLRISRSSFTLIAVAAFAAMFLLVACTSDSEEPEAGDDLALVWEAWAEIQENYANLEELDSDSVTAGAMSSLLEFSGVEPYPFLTDLGRLRGQAPPHVPGELGDIWRAVAVYRQTNPDFDRPILVETVLDGLLDGLGDPSSVFLNAERYPQAKENLETSIEGSYLGIGARVISQDGLILLFPFSGSPAEKGGVEPGDILLTVEGESVSGQAVQSVVDKVGGPEGTKVKLEVGRQGEPESLELDVFRGNVDVPSVASQLTPGGIGYMRVSRFRDNTGEQVFSALESLNQFQMLALILDLRTNPGGSVEAAGEVAGQFLPTGTLFRTVEGQDGARSEQLILEDSKRLDLEDLLLVVLVNDQTVGEAEAVAAALQDSGRAFVVGTESFGEGSDYSFIELSDNSAMYLPTSRWYTPSGNWLGGEGIKPDLVVVSEPESEGFGGETQFNRAYEYLDGLLPPFR